MEQYRLHYDLQDGYIHHWLVLGPCVETVDAILLRSAAGFVEPITTKIPTQVDKVRCGSQEYFWKLEHAWEDHRIERDRMVKQAEQVKMWAFCLLESDQPREVDAQLRVSGATALWLNGQMVLHAATAEPNDQLETDHLLRLSLQAGENKLLLLVEDVTGWPVALSAAVHLSDSTVRNGIPILSPDEAYWHLAEQAFAQSRLDRAVYIAGDIITLHGPQVEEEGLLKVNVRMQDNHGASFADLERPLMTGQPQPLVPATQLPQGSCQALLMPLLQNYYEKQFRPSRSLPFQVANQAYTAQVNTSDEERLVRLMQDAGRQEGILAEVVRLAAGWYSTIDPAGIERSLQTVRRRETGCVVDLLGLLLLQSRLAIDPQLLEKAKLPHNLPQSMQEVLTGFDYTPDPAASSVDQLIIFSAQAVAGQAYATTDFASGRVGTEERAFGESQAMAWIRQHAQWGFPAGNPDWDILAACLVLLVDLSDNPDLSDLAAVLLDKLLFLLALGSFQGLPESTRLCASAAEMKSGRFQPGADLGLLLWGEGVYNQHLTGAVCLALSQNYALPDVIRAVAQDHTTPVWARVRSQSPDGAHSVVQSLYKTPAYRLSSIQTPDAGQPGAWEHLWQATLGPEALVFTNAPGTFSQSEARRAGFWRGNRSQPQIFQWQDTLVCLYHLPAEGLIPFTHAYFPTEAFDEYHLDGNWAFARKGEAYLGLYASQGFSLVAQGDEAYRELRAYGTDTVWLCQMGQVSQDGTFENFYLEVMANQLMVDGLSIKWRTLRGDIIHAGWQDTPAVNGAAALLDPEIHIESPYAEAALPASALDIHYGDALLRLDFA